MIFFSVPLCLCASFLATAADSPPPAQGRFVRLWWYEPGIENGNPVTNRRFRVNAPAAVLHPEFSKRSETKSSGMLQILMPENLLDISAAELSLELWGGHPGTVNRRVTLNGRTTYPITVPADEHCTHAYPVISLKKTDLVQGHNALQFACDQGTTFWGHFIVEQACLRAELPPTHPDLRQLGLESFSATIAASPAAGNTESLRLTLVVPPALASRVAAVDFQGRYEGYDENGDGQTADWHGFTKTRQPLAYLGTASKPPFAIDWDQSMLPAQQNIAVRAIVHMKEADHVKYLTAPLENLRTPDRPTAKVRIHSPQAMPVPFWSRAKRLKQCTISLDTDPATIDKAELNVVVWDGGAGTVERYFTLNGHFVPVAGTGKHDVLYSRIPLEPSWLQRGDNTIELLSDTEHHGIEILYPGPAIVVRTK